MGSGLRTFIGLALLTAGFLGSLATILGFFGSTSWFFDVLANFRFHLAVGLLITAVLFFVTFGRWIAVVFLAMGLVNAWLVAPLYLDKPAPAASESTLSIISFNVGAGRADEARLGEYVAATEADLVFLLESTEEWVSAMPAATPGFRVSNEIPDDRLYGISLLGHDSTAVEQLRLGFTKDPVLRVVAEIDGQPVAVYAIHPRPPDSSLNSEARESMIRELADVVSRETMPVVVIGDFNASPWSYIFREFTAETNTVNSQNGYGLSATWPTSLPITLVPIDHMVHSESLTTVRREVGPDLGSDHLPLLVEVSLAVG